MSEKKAQATILLELIRERYRPLMGQDGTAYAVQVDGPSVALPLTGVGGLRVQMARVYTDACGGQVPGAGALSDAIAVFTGEAHACDPEPVNLRVASHGEAVVLDLGTADGRCVVATADGWTIEQRSPVLFRRTKLIAPLPTPIPGGTIDAFRALFNVADDDWPLIVGWMVGALLPDLPYPVLGLFGLRGSAKSVATRMIVNAISPSPAPTRSTPRDVKAWIIGAYAGWTSGIDNVSVISDEFSDWLCRASTGEGMIDRALYTDNDVSVISFRRPIIINGIEPVGGQGDLANRLLPIDLLPIVEYKDERDVWAAYAEALPGALGALLDLLSAVLAGRDHVTTGGVARMADFARVLAALDRATGWRSLPRYLALASATEAESLSQFGEALRDFAETTPGGRWTGTPTQLWEHLTPKDAHGESRPPKDWPNVRRMREQIKRNVPALRAFGITVDLDQRSADRNRERLIVLIDTTRTTTSEGARISSSVSSASSATASDQQKHADDTTPHIVRTTSASSARA
ncbi:ATP-binding protein [Embleya sp. NPDC059237]|uniref:ATP-binding protein n=1 Tax=Embleya sp. NPDC059237 TaxID=3346784 RepID=UPI00367BC6E6